LKVKIIRLISTDFLFMASLFTTLVTDQQAWNPCSFRIGSICRKKTDVNDQERVIPMTEKPGHFEKGIWVEDRAPAAPQTTNEDIDKRLAEATRAVISSIDTVMSVTHDLVATEDGKQYIEKTLKDTQKQIQQSFDAIISRAKAELGKTKTELDKKMKR
jgi:hypothetical protein